MTGLNYPWSLLGGKSNYGCDFGVNVWGGHAGVTSHANEVRADFDALATIGVEVVRWFVFTDGRGGVRWDPAQGLTEGQATPTPPESDRPSLPQSGIVQAGVDRRVSGKWRTSAPARHRAGARVARGLPQLGPRRRLSRGVAVELQGRRRDRRHRRDRDALVDRASPVVKRYGRRSTCPGLITLGSVS